MIDARKTIELLNRLKATVEEFAARSKELHDDFRLRLGREKQRYQSSVDEHDRELAATLAEAETFYRDAAQGSEAHQQQRKVRIGKAYQSSKELGLKRIEDNVGARKYDLQKQMLQSERARDAALAAAAAKHQEFQSNLAAEQEHLARAEQQALSSFGGYGGFRREFLKAYEKPEGELGGTHEEMLRKLQKLLEAAAADLSRLRGLFLFRTFRYILLWLVLAFVPLALGLPQAGLKLLPLPQAAGIAGAALVLVLVLRFVGRAQAVRSARSLSKTLAQARHCHDACRQQEEAYYQQELERIRNDFIAGTQRIDRELKQAVAGAGELRVSCRMHADERTVRITQRSEELHRKRLERLKRERADNVGRLKQAAEVRRQALDAAWAEREKKAQAEHAGALEKLRREWNTVLGPMYAELNTSIEQAPKLFPPWGLPAWSDWRPPASFAQAAQFGHLDVNLEDACDAFPWRPAAGAPAHNSDPMAPPGSVRFSVPLCLTYPDEGSLLFETADTGHDQAVGALNNTILRLLSVAPAGRVNFTILDPVGLGQNFAGVMHLADYEDQLINSRIWTQSTQIEQKLGELNEHMEKVIQMYLRNEYRTIAEYNEQAGVIAEKYHFLVVADFPANFTDTAAKRLLSIAASGARCGVYTLIHWDRRQPLPQDFIPDELRKSSFRLVAQGKEFLVAGRAMPGMELKLDAPPGPEEATAFVHQVGRLSRDSSRVEVPFEQVTPSEAEIWSESTTSELRVAIGRTGATKLQYLALGKGTCQHGLIAGKTGSGKSTLFHVIITNLALWCSPEEVEFYLVDFKKGVEFKCYAAQRLPHARVVAIESDREFGLSVLQRVDDELKRRGDLFRQLGVQDIPGYKRAGGKESIPRTLLMVDEFQEFFVEDDKIAQTASLLLDRIVRQGRAFGIHVLLGSQTLGGAYTVARTTLGQMVIRIALQCNEADAYLIMDDTNPAPRLLSRPGEGIYNDMAGALQGNSPFQVVWLPDQVRDDALARVRRRADQHDGAYPGPIVFEGNAPADPRENLLLKRLVEGNQIKPVAAGRIWLGAPNSIKGPTEAVFHRQSGNNLLVVGQREDAVLAIISLGLVALSAQYKPGAARFILCDATPPGTAQRAFLEKTLQCLPHQVQLAKPGDLPEIMRQLGAEMKQRAEASDAESAPPVFLFIHELQKFSRLRYEDDFSFSSGGEDAPASPGAVLNSMICEGTRLGLHVLATCDTYNNVSRFLSRKAISEFEMRILFQMSANDSASLIDNPKAGSLGLHRALFFNAQEGHLETFRPYALPTEEWLEEVGPKLARLSKVPA